MNKEKGRYGKYYNVVSNDARECRNCSEDDRDEQIDGRVVSEEATAGENEDNEGIRGVVGQ